MIFAHYLKELWHKATEENNRNLARLLEENPRARVLDLGCDNGELVTARIEKFVGSHDIWGVDIDKKVLLEAKKRGLKVHCQDLNQKLPFKNNYFDVIQANQAIEHLWNTDVFVSEAYRVLKKGGYFLISTENLASWHNIAALFLGFQAPSQSISSRYRLANPFSVCRPGKCQRPWTAHQRVFTIKGLKKLLEIFNFKVEGVLTAGYYPFPNFLARYLTGIDPLHAAFICLKARK